MELAITHHVESADLPTARVVFSGVTHPMKEEKLGLLRGVSARLRMYRQMLPYLLGRPKKG